ncbi:MAG: zinc ribbon domain-containing protein [Pseudonocardiales bacterium]|nr:zinc ribbon domain-containing protein [Pseudonocardiales bacterium]
MAGADPGPVAGRSRRVSATGEVRCSTCGEPTPPGKFCIHCGAGTQQSCPNCGQAVVAGAKFCLECGTPLAGGRTSGTASVAFSYAPKRTRTSTH